MWMFVIGLVSLTSYSRHVSLIYPKKVSELQKTITTSTPTLSPAHLKNDSDSTIFKKQIRFQQIKQTTQTPAKLNKESNSSPKYASPIPQPEVKDT